MPGRNNAVPPVTLNRLSVYLRCLRRLREQGVRRVSSQELARQYRLSAAQIRKDLTQFGEFGIRGVGYDVTELCDRLAALLSLDRSHPIVVVGMGNLGSALAATSASTTTASRWWPASTKTPPRWGPGSAI